MKTRASTADLVAAVRALHQRDRVRLVDDPYAILLCGRSVQAGFCEFVPSAG